MVIADPEEQQACGVVVRAKVLWRLAGAGSIPDAFLELPDVVVDANRCAEGGIVPEESDFRF